MLQNGIDMTLSRYALVSYVFYVSCYVFFLAITYQYYEGGKDYSLSYLPGDIASALFPLIFAGLASLIIRLFKHPSYNKVFQWILICFSILIGLFSLLAAYLSWWSAGV